MPPKSQPKPSNAPSGARRNRRKNTQKKGKPANQQQHPNRKVHKSNRYGASMGYIGAALKTQGSSLAALTVLAKSIVAPRDMPPMRFPEIRMQRTDSRHVWMGNTCRPVTREGGGSGYQPRIGGTTLATGDAMFFLTKDPVAPLIFSYGTSLGTSNDPLYTTPAKYSLSFAGQDVSQTLGGSLNGCTFLTTRSFTQQKTPANATVSMAERVLSPVASVIRTTSGPCDSDEAVYLMENGSTYFFYGGGYFEATIFQTNLTGSAQPQSWSGVTKPVPAGGGIKVFLSLQRYTGGNDDDDVHTFEVVMLASAFFGTLVIGPSSSIDAVPPVTSVIDSGKLSVGLYRFSLLSIIYEAPTDNFEYSPLVLAINKYVGGNNNYVFLNPVMSNVRDTKYAYQKVRANTTALLLTTTTPGMFRGGNVYAAKFCVGDGFDNISPDEVTDRSCGNSRNSYRGDLAKGAYTWMEPDCTEMLPSMMDSGVMVSTTTSFTGARKDLNATLPIVRVRAADSMHVIFLQAPMPTTSSSAFMVSNQMLMWRLDMGIEFISNSQMCNNAMSALRIEDFTRATQTLANCPLFTENWIHLDQLWGIVKRVGKNMLLAGGSAAARVALQEMATGLAALAV